MRCLCQQKNGASRVACVSVRNAVYAPRIGVGGTFGIVASKRKYRLHEWPYAKGGDWLSHANQVVTNAELAALHGSVPRGVPLGVEAWQRQTATASGPESSLGRPGRSRKQKTENLALFLIAGRASRSRYVGQVCFWVAPATFMSPKKMVGW